jgi:pimeloyl-ACP methyl ester carboxylesterase
MCVEEVNMHQVRSEDGTAIAYARTGTGPPLLLVHGTTADHTRWAPILPQLEEHFSVYAMDRRGRGASGDAPEYSTEREAEDVAAVVEAIGRPVHVLGHSFGGLCSLEAALLTDNVSKLILYEPDAPTGDSPLPPGIIERTEGLIDRGELEAAAEMIFREVVEMPEHELQAFRRLPVWKVRVSLAPTIPRELKIYRTYRFQPERFSGLYVPTMLLLGGESPHAVREPIERIDAALPSSRLVILPGEQHIAMDTNPGLFVGEVLRFLRE